jgi:hypothetical protein
MADINIGEIVATTLRNRSGKLADNVLNHNALFARLNKKGMVKTVSGGREIVQELEYAENGTAGWYSGYEILDVTPQEVFDAATFDWKQLAGNVVISGLEEIKNSGKEASINLIASRIKNLEKTLKNKAATAVYADGTTDTKSLGGLQLLVADDPTASATIGGINQNTYTFWRNQTSGDATLTTYAEIKAEMNALWLSCIRGTDKPDCIVADANLYALYEGGLQDYQRFASADSAGAGFENVRYKTADVFYDDQCPANHMYFLNTDYIYLRPHASRQFVPLDDRNSINQDATVMPVVWAGNMTVSNRSLQGVLYT